MIVHISMASGPSVRSWLAALRSAGYTVSGVFIDLPVDEAVRRAQRAHRQGEDDYLRGVGNGGRYIPADAIRALAGHPRPAAPAVSTKPTVSTTAVHHGHVPGEGPVADLVAAYQTGGIDAQRAVPTSQVTGLARCPVGVLARDGGRAGGNR